MQRKSPRVLIVVENLPVPFDRRVWQEALALRRAGWDVSVICPKGKKTHTSPYEEIEGIRIYRHSLPLEAKHSFAFLFEYVAALFHEMRLTMKVVRTSGFDVIQACNPPDLIFLGALPFKLFGKKFVFDHHDLCPELFVAKFGKKGPVHLALRGAQWLTFKLADLVISANDTYRDVAIQIGGKAPQDVVTVYSVPDRKWTTNGGPGNGNGHANGNGSGVKNGNAPRRTYIGYVGIIAAQDGVDHLIHATHQLLASGHSDIETVIVGDGPAVPALQKLVNDLGLSDYVVFTGYQTGEALLEILSSFDIGVIPDPLNEYNHTISMNKVFEYSALGIPIVSYPLKETRRLLGDAAVYSADGTPGHLARAIEKMLVDKPLRKTMAARSRALGQKFNWENEAARYVKAYERFLPA